MKGTRDLAVIGGGPGGLVIASVAAQQGLKVTLVEKSDRLGGDCLHTGCVPSKTLIRSARLAHQMRNGHKYGLPAMEPVIDMQRVIDRVDEVIAQLQQHDDPERFRSYGCEVRFGAARFAGPHEITVDADTIRSRRLVIATGSRPLVPPIPGIEAAGFDTNETIFKRRELPQRLAVIGSGPVGVELAQAFARLGSQVTVLEKNGRVYPVADPDVSDCLARVLQEEGVRLQTGVEITSARRDGDSRQLQLADGATVECDRLLVATGRRPDISGLGLDIAGVEHTPKGITVDRRLRTSQRHILAVGDVCGPWQFTHMAEYQAGIVLAGLLFRIPRKVDYRVVPRVTYTDPEIAEVGLNETAAREQGLRYDVARFPFSDIDRSATDSAGEGFLKILLVKGRIAGASLVGPHAGELIHELALAMQVNAKARAVTDLVHAYPTYAQIHRRAVNARYSDLFYSRKIRFLVRLINKLIP
ncbi:MAG: mercuric reductase [Gammaproteobacteria bacterium]|nr:MAG: mercuric reductase [Gammaproteobacteria bacterium]